MCRLMCSRIWLMFLFVFVDSLLSASRTISDKTRPDQPLPDRRELVSEGVHD